MNLNWKKGIGFGVLIWAVMFIVISILVGYKMPQDRLFTFIVAFVSMIAVYFCTKSISPKSYIEAIIYGLIFVIVGLILDYFISIRFAPYIFSSISYWLSYLLIVVVSMLPVAKMLHQSQNPQ